ncbi:universal stress protein [Aureibaculum sp. A20]|uniref:Universal stress protein n=1 Tax=Aureibaculum flavum TaxID=2795986 RepID=A0ABS0WLP0_9FLAO|nr:universal stress protein [Aureibaculum flavum]MBJ2172880.1 universal stress protein [Aureibaculum flavum]
MKNILYATDYSKYSVTALQYAYQLSTKMNIQLKVIHVFHYPSTLLNIVGDTEPDFGVNYFEKHASKLEQFCIDNLGYDLTNITVEAVENKSVLNGIIEKAQELDSTFVVVGTKGNGTIKDFIMGNTTKNLIEKSLFPILSIPYQKRISKIKTIVYATAFEEDDIHAICKLTEIAEPLKSEIKVVHASLKDEYPGEVQMAWFKEMIANKIKYDKISFEVISSDDVFNSLRLYAEKNDADLIAMLDRKKGGFLKKLLNKDTVLLMNDYGKYPLISFNVSNCLKLNFS